MKEICSMCFYWEQMKDESSNTEMVRIMRLVVHILRIVFSTYKILRSTLENAHRKKPLRLSVCLSSPNYES